MKVALSKLPIIIYPRWLQENEKHSWTRSCAKIGGLVNVCCFCSSGMFVAIGMMVSCERVCQEPCSEAKCRGTVVRRNPFDKTVVLMPNIMCPIRISSSSRGRLDTVSQMQGMLARSLYSLRIKPVYVWIFFYLRSCANYCHFPVL
jgi:hypothetical protein